MTNNSESAIVFLNKIFLNFKLTEGVFSNFGLIFEVNVYLNKTESLIKIQRSFNYNDKSKNKKR